MSTLCKVMTGAFVAALCVPVPQAQALLVDRGSGMLYDTVLNVTWLQDANQGSTPILRTLSLSPILGQRSVHVEAQALQP